MKFHLSAIAISLVLGAGSQLSQAAVIDFEDIATSAGNAVFDSSPDASGGFLFTSPSNHIHRVNQFGSFGDSGSTNLMIHDNGGANAGNGLTMTKVGGGTFGMSSAWLSEGFSNFGAKQVHIVGSLFGGGSVVLDFTLDGIFDGAGGLNDFQTVNFDGSWNNLTSVAFNGIGGTANEHAWSIDNINVGEAATTVPEPSTLALMALAMVGLGFMRRRKLA
ncbi:PEP-CTERM sorting domain-containing protein [Undibacterium sp.]|uniref:PEP-CTERM sorting domain-containing protein n=1 Tax=Undibacterium sp. TaxID=1914977 RepID=UPI0025CEC61C|nr:PEP-CTERM sorting domain-containing protein [Undibacterium sp.]